MIKERTTIRVSGTSVDGDSATVGFTSDAIYFKDVWQLSVNFYFLTALTFTGKSPTLTIEESNDRGASDSFVPVEGWTDINVPEFFKDFKTTSEYILVYNEQGATGGTIGVQTRIIKP
jgi:hypothetical protein